MVAREHDSSFRADGLAYSMSFPTLAIMLMIYVASFFRFVALTLGDSQRVGFRCKILFLRSSVVGVAVSCGKWKLDG